MQIQNAVTKFLSRAAICGLLVMLAACGSSKEPKACEQAVTVNMDAGIAYYVAVGGYNLSPTTSSYQLAIVPSTIVHSSN